MRTFKSDFLLKLNTLPESSIDANTESFSISFDNTKVFELSRGRKHPDFSTSFGVGTNELNFDVGLSFCRCDNVAGLLVTAIWALDIDLRESGIIHELGFGF